MTKLPALLTASMALALLVPIGRADEIEWSTEANMDRQLFPSLLIATATQRPPEDEKEGKEPDPWIDLAEARVDGIMPISYFSGR